MNHIDYREVADILPFPLTFDHILLLTGSKGWGIAESADNLSDYDFLILCDRQNFDQLYERDMTIVSTTFRNRKCFVQIRSLQWLDERLDSESLDIQVLYQWIVMNARLISGNAALYDQIRNSSLEKYRKNHVRYLTHYAIKYKVREYDMRSAKKRGLKLEYLLYAAQYMENAIKLLSSLHGMPFPYPKWYSKHLLLLDSANDEFLELLHSETFAFNGPVYDLKEMQKKVENFLLSRAVGTPLAIHETLRNIFEKWWIYNEN
ncbi:hypothetical protein HUK80_06125 [Flavobacterium sp. MAH-1]|uniref:Nucleotidyltransferase domain-containing protein n=1 Tax=Flavobacterium agri TaxID=2743471 RepID=A0A7Y8Y125_9FLAO|nr:hypothetical protein [Flavobacterium agri]NUY80466.1 hypothetical protein [Flavobacterium agri]NYA70491.1 hypothetical protein [Flavobacterium agri]